MEWVEDEPDHKNWIATPGAATTQARTDLEKRSGYSGRPGPHWDEAVGVFGAHVRHLEREIQRYRLTDAKPMYPPEPESDDESSAEDEDVEPPAPLTEETPFGTVLADRSKRNDPNFLNSGMVSYIKTRPEDFEKDEQESEEGSEPESPKLARAGGKKQPKQLGYETYEDLAKHMRASGRGPEMAHEVLREVYLALARRVGGETNEQRQVEAAKRQAAIEEAWPDPGHRRVMAVLYALTLLSEDQRSAGGKTMRSALRLVADERMTPEEAFTKEGVEGPAVAQTLRKGGMKLLRFSWRGGLRPSPKTKLVHHEESSSSDAEDEPELRKARWLRRSKDERKDELRIAKSKQRGAKRAAGLSTWHEEEEDSDDEMEEARPRRARSPDPRTSNRKRKRSSQSPSSSSRPEKLRRLTDDPRTGQRSRPGGSPRRSARLAEPSARETQLVEDDATVRARGQAKRRSLRAHAIPEGKL